MTFPIPELPEGRTRCLPGRGEMFFRRSQGGRVGDPTVLLLHGWTASADTQFFSAYPALMSRYSFVAPDHRGHGRGMRARFTLEDVADDAAALVRSLGVGPVVTVGFSMGGPISMLLADRHPDLVAGMIVQATSLEWLASRLDRIRWKGLRLLGFGLRSRFYPKLLQLGVARATHGFPDAERWLPWFQAEVRRNDPIGVLEAGWSLSSYDARGWAPKLGLPAASLITTADRLVKPAKQRALADALDARVWELPVDHLCTLTDGPDYARVTIEQLDHVVAAVRERQASTAAG